MTWTKSSIIDVLQGSRYSSERCAKRNGGSCNKRLKKIYIGFVMIPIIKPYKWLNKSTEIRKK